MRPQFLQTRNGKLPLPIFFPDATRAVVKTLDQEDLKKTKTPGLLVNTYHLYRQMAAGLPEKFGGIGPFMNWKGGLISDSGGFQIMSLVKNRKKAISDEGVRFTISKKQRVVFTPEDSLDFQEKLKTDIRVVLDDFTPPEANRREAEESVRRTIVWAKRSKETFEKNLPEKSAGVPKPYLIAVVQGGNFLDLRRKCARELRKIGFDGFGYGGWPINQEGKFDLETAKVIAAETPENYLLYGLGVGKPEDIVACYRLGFRIFDCVLPTRDARHRRLYVFDAESKEKIDVNRPDFYRYYVPDKKENESNEEPVSRACDCLLCRHYSRAYLYHLFKIRDLGAFRLASIHNLRFYSLLMEKLREQIRI